MPKIKCHLNLQRPQQQHRFITNNSHFFSFFFLISLLIIHNSICLHTIISVEHLASLTHTQPYYDNSSEHRCDASFVRPPKNQLMSRQCRALFLKIVIKSVLMADGLPIEHICTKIIISDAVSQRHKHSVNTI